MIILLMEVWIYFPFILLIKVQGGTCYILFMCVFRCLLIDYASFKLVTQLIVSYFWCESQALDSLSRFVPDKLLCMRFSLLCKYAN